MILSRLKEETRPQHEALEARVDIVGRAATPAGYTGLLGHFHGYYARAEPSLDGFRDEFARAGIDLDARRKLPMLRRDLIDLGLDESAIDALPTCDDLPPLAGLPEAFGRLYVMEGATLGGQFIRKHVAATLGLGPDRGCAFFSSYGDRVGPMWRSFGAALSAFATGPGEQDAVVRSAAETFATFDRWFARGKDRR